MRLFLGALTLLPLLAAAETAYVTDNLRLSMWETADLTGNRVETLVKMRRSFAEPQALVDRLRQESAQLQETIDGNATRMQGLEEENKSHVSSASRYQYSLPYNWVGGAIIICLIGGFLSGLWWIDRQSRRRHGGIRVY